MSRKPQKMPVRWTSREDKVCADYYSAGASGIEIQYQLHKQFDVERNSTSISARLLVLREKGVVPKRPRAAGLVTKEALKHFKRKITPMLKLVPSIITVGPRTPKKARAPVVVLAVAAYDPVDFVTTFAKVATGGHLFTVRELSKFLSDAHESGFNISSLVGALNRVE